MINKVVYTKPALEVLELAGAYSSMRCCDFTGTSELLFGLTNAGNSISSSMLVSKGLRRSDRRSELLEIAKRMEGHLPPLSPRASEVISDAETLALNNSDGKAELGSEHILFALMSGKESSATIEMCDAGIPVRQCMNDLLSIIEYGSENADQENETDDGDFLKKYARNLTREAKNKKLDPLIGREKEIKRVIDILLRRRKNAPCITGEPGVGKSALVEGLCSLIVSKNVPDPLLETNVYALDISACVAGTKFRGEFEERLNGILRDVSDSGSILFIDEIHTIIGAGSADGTLDAASIIKPYLDRGRIRLIGATTSAEFSRRIERNPAFARRFERVELSEPDIKTSCVILKGLRAKYEEHHGVKITDDAIESAVVLSSRYITGRALPDKAIDVIDEASAIMASDKEGKGIVSADEIKKVVTDKTGIPVSYLSSGERSRLQGLETRLNRRVIGQQKAVSVLSNAVLAQRAGVRSSNRPGGVFLFCGPTGVGKTELAKALADEVFSASNSFIRIDMSEYMEKSSVAKLIGSPPGYVGYGEGGKLTEAVARRPYSLVLFDEIEKADREVFDLLLQVTDDGILTDSTGKKVDFRNTIIIFTSNAGASEAENVHKSAGFISNDKGKKAEELYMSALKRTFKPEFINRIDEIVFFDSLSQDSIRKITALRLKELSDRLINAGVSLHVTTGVICILADKGYDEAYGARPLNRVIRREIEEPLSRILIRKKNPSSVRAYVKNGKIEIEVAGSTGTAQRTSDID